MSLFDHFLAMTLKKALIGDLLRTLLAPKTGFRVQNGFLGYPPLIPSDHGSFRTDFRWGLRIRVPPDTRGISVSAFD